MAEQIEKQKAIELLQQRLEETENSEFCRDVTGLSQLQLPSSIDAWRTRVLKILDIYFGKNSQEYNDFQSALDIRCSTKEFWGNDDEDRYRRAHNYLQGIVERARNMLKAILDNTKEFGITKRQENLTEKPKVFIAHGGSSKALQKISDFLIALNLEPLVVESTSSEGRSVNQQVELCLDNADCAIILGTSDEKHLKDGKFYPRPNVFIEIGRVQDRFPSKVIYLLEEGASLPSNISEKIYERFTQENMEMAFIKIAKELTQFGIIKTTNIKEQNV